MKISVITATYNSAATVRDTLKSVAEQDYLNKEYIVIDGTSTDGTVKIVESSTTKVDILVSEKDKGIYDALNKGIQKASGDVIGFMHSDDIYAHPKVLSRIAEVFSSNDIDCVYGDLNYISRNDQSKVIRNWVAGTFDRAKLRSGWMPPHPTFYMRRECYEKFGGFDTSYRISADYDSILRYLWKQKLQVQYIPEVLVKMRIGGTSNRSLTNIIKKIQEDVSAMHKHKIPVGRAIVLKNVSKLPQFLTGKSAVTFESEERS